MSNHLIKELDREVDSLRDALSYQVDVYNKVINWLEAEMQHNEPVINGDEVLTDGSQDIHVGRNECAESLLKQIKKWEAS